MTEAQMRLAIVRSDKLRNYYAAERNAGTPPLLANERMHEFAKRLDGECPFKREQEAVARIMMESVL